MCSLITPILKADLFVLFRAFSLVPCCLGHVCGCLLRAYAEAGPHAAESHGSLDKKTFSEVLPHTWVIETVCGNTNLSPWWRNLCLSTVFYSVSSDDKCNRIKPVKCTGPGWVLNVCLTCGTYSAARFLGLGTYLFLKAKPLLHWICVHKSI